MKELYILGASGHGKVVMDIAESMNKYEKIHFYDDNAEAVLKVSGKNLVEGNMEKLIQCAKVNPEAEVIVAIGNNEIRQRIQEHLEQEGIQIATLIHRNATCSNHIQIGKGTVVMPGTVINHSTVIGKGCIINTSSSVDHDNQIGDYCHISVGSHLAGTVTVGNRTMVGAGAVVKNNIKIGANCVIGAGAVVVNDIEVPGIYMGIPARIHKVNME